MTDELRPSVGHVHLHRFVDGERRLEHSHPYPDTDQDELAARRHAHSNGEHSHPHRHVGYELAS